VFLQQATSVCRLVKVSCTGFGMCQEIGIHE
jgi:hypothetical protein